jgi:putative tryptophan/tyrosine transport system substrate-binding protein
MMDRRAFVAGTVGVLATPLAVKAEQAGKRLPRVTIVSAGQPLAEMLGPDPIAPDYRLLIHTLRDRGWVDGQTVVIETRCPLFSPT